MNIDGYEVMRRDRNRNGGGVALYIRSSINYRTRFHVMPENLETITVEVQKPRAKAFLIQIWYRPQMHSMICLMSLKNVYKK